MKKTTPYCKSLYQYSRRKTHPVKMGTIAIGGKVPVLVQSMTTTRALDIQESVRETLELQDAGCDLVRITAPGVKDAAAFAEIRMSLLEKGSMIPLVADIHFNPAAALEAASHVEKVRINPGNYSSAKVVKSDEEYRAALDELEKNMLPLLTRCKQKRVAIRLGVNHGSLAPRVMERYGAGPIGMVQSLLELIEVCRKHDFHDIVLSLKASTPRMMVTANRLLAAELRAKKWDYPIHLGVTESGDGLEGRVKSALGIGALLADGIGDTIRVSLSEAPIQEIEVCKAIKDTVEVLITKGKMPTSKPLYNPYNYSPRETERPEVLRNAPKGILGIRYLLIDMEDFAEDIQDMGFMNGPGGEYKPGPDVPDFVQIMLPNATRKEIRKIAKFPFSPAQRRRILVPVLSDEEEEGIAQRHVALDGSWYAVSLVSDTLPMLSLPHLRKLLNKYHPENTLLILSQMLGGLGEQRYAMHRIMKAGSKHTVLHDFSLFLEATMLERDGESKMSTILSGLQQIIEDREEGIEEDSGQLPLLEDESLAIVSHTLPSGCMLLDGLGEGMVISEGHADQGLALLQACELRRVKAEIISCPSCGRTLFDLSGAAQAVKQHFGHLRHLKIGVMGCIVNGPGEMADADYGYVGAGPGKVSIYKGQKEVRKGVSAKEALTALEEVIRENGDWEERDEKKE